MLVKKKRLKHMDAIAVSYGAMFVEGSLNAVIVALMVVLSQRFNRPSGDIAMLVSIKSFGTLLMLFFSGKVSDKYGRKIPIVFGSVLFSIFIFGFMVTTDYYLALMFAFIGGLAHGLMDTPGMSLLFDALTGNTGPAMSIIQVFFAGGSVLTTLMASWFIRYNINFQWIFVVILIINILLLILVLITRYPPISGKKTSRQYLAFEVKPSIKREGLILFFCSLLASSYNAIMSTWLPTYIEQIKLFDVASSVSTLSLLQIGALIGSFVFALVLRKLHTTVLMGFNPMIGAILLSLLLVTTNSMIIQMAVFGLGFTMGVYFSLCINMGGELFIENAGAATGAIATASMAGSTVVVWLSGRFIETVGITTIYYCTLVVMILLIVLANAFRFQYRKLKP